MDFRTILYWFSKYWPERKKKRFSDSSQFLQVRIFLQKVAGLLIAKLVGSIILERTVHNDVNGVLFANSFCKNFAINIIFLVSGRCLVLQLISRISGYYGPL